MSKAAAAEAFFRAKVPGLMDRLMAELPFDLDDAAAVFGNAGGESAGFTILQEIKPTVPGSRGGFGWFQWTGPRRKAYEAWSRRNKLDPSSDDANFGYLIVELKGSEKATVPAVKAAVGLEAKVKAFEVKFERPGKPHTAGRVKWARIALDAWRKANGKAPATPKPGPKAPPAPGTDPVYDNVQAIRHVQERLLALGYTEVGRADGAVGGMTKAAILLFRQDNGLPLTAEIDDALILALATAPQRKLVPGRENATDKTVVENAPEARPAWWTRLSGKALAAVSAAALMVKGVLEQIPVVKDWVEPAINIVGDVPGWVWPTVLLIGGGALWYAGNHGFAKAKEAFQTGARR